MVAVKCFANYNGSAPLAGLSNLLRTVAREMPERLASETRRAGIYVCASLRSRTRVAPKRARKAEIVAMPSYLPPRYVHSNSAHHRLLRRWFLARKQGTSDVYSHHHFVYTDAQRVKRGKKWVMTGKNQRAELAELLRLHGGIQRHGLAKKSWGWVAHKIYTGKGGDLSWHQTKHDRRDPRKYVSGSFQKNQGGATVYIHNKLDYAKQALKPGGFDAAITAATKRMRHNIEGAILAAQNAIHNFNGKWVGNARIFEVSPERIASIDEMERNAVLGLL